MSNPAGRRNKKAMPGNIMAGRKAAKIATIKAAIVQRIKILATGEIKETVEKLKAISGRVKTCAAIVIFNPSAVTFKKRFLIFSDHLPKIG